MTLKEQITPFEVDICVIEKELDFSHMADHLQKIAVRVVLTWSRHTKHPRLIVTRWTLCAREG